MAIAYEFFDFVVPIELSGRSTPAAESNACGITSA